MQVRFFATLIADCEVLFLHLKLFKFIFFAHVLSLCLFKRSGLDTLYVRKVKVPLRFGRRRGRRHHLAQVVEQPPVFGLLWRAQLGLVKHAHWRVIISFLLIYRALIFALLGLPPPILRHNVCLQLLGIHTDRRSCRPLVHLPARRVQQHVESLAVYQILPDRQLLLPLTVLRRRPRAFPR